MAAEDTPAVAVAEPSWNDGPVDIPHRSPMEDNWSSWSSWNDNWSSWSSANDNWSSWSSWSDNWSSWSSWNDNDYPEYDYDYSSATCATFAAAMLIILAQ